MPNDEVVRMKEELDSLNNIRNRLEKEIHCLHEQKAELTARLENSEAVNTELHSRVRFLEGQVEAYQYCLNCRR